jgi:hypothetical protein
MLQSLRLYFGPLILIFSVFIQAHDGRPVYIELNQSNATAYELAWRLPPTLDQINLPSISLDETCEANAEVGADGGLLGTRLYHCSGGVPQSITLDFPRTNPSLSSIVRIARLNLPARVVHAGPGEVEIEVPSEVGSGSIFTEYGRLGIEHILGGYDHLLFIVCLMWLAYTWKRIFLAITGFTLAHSITLALSAVEVITPAIEPTEALIALSIVFVAAELTRQKKATLSWRFPVAVSSVFGLLHGLGFASVLKEIGLPNDDSILALLAFNLGVELGQLFFIVLTGCGAWLVVKAGQGAIKLDSDRTRLASGYLVGALAAFWFFQRLANF